MKAKWYTMAYEELDKLKSANIDIRLEDLAYMFKESMEEQDSEEEDIELDLKELP